MTKGFKTSEFYVALMGLVGLTWTFLQQNCDLEADKSLAFAGVVGSYIIGRSWVKSRNK